MPGACLPFPPGTGLADPTRFAWVAAASRMVQGSHKKMSKILVADDEDEVRFAIRAVLEDVGHEVIEARDGEDGLATFEKAKFDLVVCDMIMPKKEGVEF